MFSWKKKDNDFLEGRCLSADSKPVNTSMATVKAAGVPYPYSESGVPNGTSLLEMDTGTTVYYDGDNDAWVPAAENA